jgi:hypothetical protein
MPDAGGCWPDVPPGAVAAPGVVVVVEVVEDEAAPAIAEPPRARAASAAAAAATFFIDCNIASVLSWSGVTRVRESRSGQRVGAPAEKRGKVLRDVRSQWRALAYPPAYG